MENAQRPKTQLERQIGRYQALLVPIVGEFVALMDEFEILQPCLDQGIMKRFIQNPYLAYRTLMIALATQCGIRTHQLLEGNGGLEGKRKYALHCVYSYTHC